MRKRKYPKTNDYYVYVHLLPNTLKYYGKSKQSPSQRFKPELYRETCLLPYIEQYGWDKIEHIIIQDGLTELEAKRLETNLIIEGWKKGDCINLILSIPPKSSSPEQKIYNRVGTFNYLHPDKMIETPLEARRKYFATGYIPNYIKNNDLYKP